MKTIRSGLAPLLAAGGLALFVGAPGAMAAPQPQNNGDYVYRADRISTQGEITSIVREGDRYRVVLNNGSYAYYVPVSVARNHDLRVGDMVRIGGLVTGDTVNADYLAWRGESGYTADPMYRGVPFGQNGWMSGTVVSVNRHLNFLTMRDDATGVPVKVDVRHMDIKRSVNVWRTRAGDHISVNGSWENRDTFDANRVQY